MRVTNSKTFPSGVHSSYRLTLQIPSKHERHNTYNSVKKDFNHDKAWKHFAGAQEMLGITQIFIEDDRPVDCRYFDVAINAYMKCNATLYGCRAMLIVTEMLTSRGQFKEASTFFMKMTHEESDLRSALLYEQASMCFLQMKPPCQRRAAFHLVLAGHRFTKAMQRVHALRCYLQARYGARFRQDFTLAFRVWTQFTVPTGNRSPPSST
jgi:hypothetical protein